LSSQLTELYILFYTLNVYFFRCVLKDGGYVDLNFF